MVHNNVHNAFYPNLMFLSFGNNLLIVRDPSGVLVWSICVRTCSCFMMLVCEQVNLKWYLWFLALYFIINIVLFMLLNH